MAVIIAVHAMMAVALGASVADLRGAPETWIWALGGALFVARVGHALGLSRSVGVSVGRCGGTTLTMVVTIAAAIVAVLTG